MSSAAPSRPAAATVSSPLNRSRRSAANGDITTDTTGIATEPFYIRLKSGQKNTGDMFLYGKPTARLLFLMIKIYHENIMKNISAREKNKSWPSFMFGMMEVDGKVYCTISSDITGKTYAQYVDKQSVIYTLLEHANINVKIDKNEGYETTYPPPRPLKPADQWREAPKGDEGLLPANWVKMIRIDAKKEFWKEGSSAENATSAENAPSSSPSLNGAASARNAPHNAPSSSPSLNGAASARNAPHNATSSALFVNGAASAKNAPPNDPPLNVYYLNTETGQTQAEMPDNGPPLQYSVNVNINNASYNPIYFKDKMFMDTPLLT